MSFWNLCNFYLNIFFVQQIFYESFDVRTLYTECQRIITQLWLHLCIKDKEHYEYKNTIAVFLRL